MKEIKKLFLSILLMFILTFKVNAATSFPATIDVGFTGTLEYSGSKIVHKILPDSTQVYCLEWNKTAPVRTCSLMEQENEADYVGLAALIDSVDDSSREQYYYASMAVHYFMEGFYGNEVTGDRAKAQPYIDVADRTKARYNGFNVTASADSYEFEQVDDYLVSKVISVNNQNGDSYSVELDYEGAEVINKTDNSFQIRIPVTSVNSRAILNVNATVKAVQNYKLSARYYCDRIYQAVSPDILVDKTREKTVNLTFSLTEDPDPVVLTKLQISKQDVTTGKELPGATLQILDSNGNEITDEQGNILYKWVSTDTPYYIEGLNPGKYFLVETLAPNGYVLNQEKIEFELQNNGEIVSVVMKNTPIVDVPATGYNTSLFILSIGLIALISGSLFIGLNVKKQY